jgi:hypothetical protein
MSRFARMQGGPTRIWAPPESPFRIEYSPALLREVRLASGGVDAFGVLYGVRHAQTIRVVATRGRGGLEPVGVFASRVRGKVFLTEEDLERFEKADACVALVISGDHGGFFVRDASGSIETVRSYEEFSLQGPVMPRPVVVEKKRKWAWAFCILLIPLLFYRPHHPQLALTLRENGGQLQIAWSVPTTSTLTILDGGERTYVPIAPDQSTATYARRSGDVTVGIGSAQARFVGPALPPTEIQQIRAGVVALHARIAMLRATRAAEETTIAQLERRLQ